MDLQRSRETPFGEPGWSCRWGGGRGNCRVGWSAGTTGAPRAAASEAPKAAPKPAEASFEEASSWEHTGAAHWRMRIVDAIDSSKNSISDLFPKLGQSWRKLFRESPAVFGLSLMLINLTVKVSADLICQASSEHLYMVWCTALVHRCCADPTEALVADSQQRRMCRLSKHESYCSIMKIVSSSFRFVSNSES